MSSSWNASGIICVLAGAIAALGTVPQIFGISPGRVSAREASIDLFINHLVVFGLFCLTSWVTVVSARPKKPCVIVTVVCSLIFLKGLMH